MSANRLRGQLRISPLPSTGAKRVPHRVAEIDVIQAALIKVLANPYRLRVIEILGRGPLGVNALARELGLAPAATSQHLSAMRGVGLVTAEREGRVVRYAVADPEIRAACELMRGVIGRRVPTVTSKPETHRSQVINA